MMDLRTVSVTTVHQKKFVENMQHVVQLLIMKLLMEDQKIQRLIHTFVVVTSLLSGFLKGGYQNVEDELLAGENVDAYYLEYDTDRAGDFKPLAKVGKK